MYFDVNYKTFVQVNKWCFCWRVNYVDFKMHGAKIKENYKKGRGWKNYRTKNWSGLRI